ncbi:MAG: TIR domain-containing protein [Eubacterium sp.]|nr:TIR domain-containing protein [Eubacterium sp.]
MKERKHPYIYISYSWDSDEHKEKVKNFVKALRLDNINVTYDEDLPFRERLPHYMEKAIIDSDIVLFICTPNYKYCADNRVSVVGTENQIITSELYETYNKNQFIPILFSGTWETSLPTWAKGKLGADLSTQELYKTNYQKLIQYLQNTTPNFRLVGATGKNIEERMLSSRTYVEINSLKSTIKTCWKKISDVNTFRGLVLVAVVSGVILSLVTPFFSSPDTPMSDNSSFSNTIASGEHADNSVPNNEFIEDANTDDPTLNSNVSDNPTPSKVPYDEDVLNAIILEDLVSNLATNPANGTMPKGTAPITITLPNDMQEKLDSIQKLSIGSSKNGLMIN